MHAYDEVANSLSSQTDIAYKQIYKLLIRSRPGDGAVWYERALSDQLAMGRTPVREALKRLQTEGLLVPASVRGGLVAARVPSEEVAGIYQVRAALESVAAELAAGRARRGELSSAQLGELAHRAEAVRKCIESGDSDGATEANSAFHRFIAQLAANPYLERPLGQLWSRITLSALSNLVVDPEWATTVNADHAELVRCISSGDAAAAAEIARVHIRRAADIYTAHSNREREGDKSRGNAAVGQPLRSR